MTKEEIINYVMNTPTNTNRAVLSSMLDDYNGGGGGSGEMVFTEEFKTSLLNIFEQVAYVNGNGQNYYDTLEAAMNTAPAPTPKALTSISAVFTQGANVIYDSDTLDSLKQYLVVTAHYDDGSSATITNYTLSGTLVTGTSTITVNYEDKTTTFTVTVTHATTTYDITNTLVGCTSSNSATLVADGASYSATITANNGYSLTGATVSVTMDDTDITSTAYNNGTISIASVTGNLVITITAVAVILSSISAVYTQAGTVYTTDSLNSLKSDLVVTAHYSDSSEAEVAAANYTLSGTLSVGTSTITVSYSGKTTTFSVIVTEPVALSSIEATFTQGGNTIYDDATLDSLKQYLEVVATYSDSSTVTLQDSDYTLSGTLAEGTSTITATYEGKTDTFSVTVTHRLIPSAYQPVEYIASDGNAHFEIRDINYPVGAVYKVKMLQTQRDTENNRVAVGCLTADTKYFCIGYKKDANNVGGFHYYDGCWTTLTKAYTEPSIVTITSTSSSVSVTAENTTESQSNTVSTQVAVQNVIKLGMFWDNREANALVGRVYDVEIKNGNTTLSHFVPCYRISDNEIGMYETVSGVFYTSNTGTSFTKGGNI